MKSPQRQLKPTRVLLGLVVVLAVTGLGWLAWEPGAKVVDGRHDRGRNGIWLQHGWLGDDAWFTRNDKQDQVARFRSASNLVSLAALLRTNGITDVFPHLCPCSINGEVAPRDPAQLERFLDHMEGFRVMPWVGGVLGVQARVHKAEWRETFVRSVVELLTEHPRLAGVQLNIEPMPSGNGDLLKLLDELRAALPTGKLLSVAAYPPPTRWQPVPDVHWDEAYFKEVAARADQMAVMMYDTALFSGKLYRQLMRSWTREVLAWSGKTSVLLGVPAYDDAGTGYHDPRVENLENAIRGIHAGLVDFDELPENFQGLAIYSEWEMEPAEWETWRTEFSRNSSRR